MKNDKRKYVANGRKGDTRPRPEAEVDKKTNDNTNVPD